MMPDPLPKTLWFLWFQGHEQAPRRVKQCFSSWKKWNPGWTIVFLSDGNLKKYVPDLAEIIGENSGIIKPQAISDIVRINILNRHGGVWADASCLCRRPLDEWIHEATPTGFFAFQNPGKDRMVASWFIAATTRSMIAERWCRAVNFYWKQNLFKRRTPSKFAALLNRNRFLPIFWNSWYLTKFKKAYPYYWFHYLFAGLYYLDSAFRREWKKIPVRQASPLIKLNSLGLDTPLTPALREWIDSSTAPCLKMSSRTPQTSPEIETLQDYLLKPYAADDTELP